MKLTERYVILMLFLTLFAGFGLSVETTPVRAELEAVSKAQFDALIKDIKSIKSDLAGIKKELQVIRQSLSQRPTQAAPPADVVAEVSVSGNPIMGKKDAPITLIEFSDYQCPFCHRFWETTLPELKKEYVETGKVRYVFRDFPLDRIHPYARKAAEATHCAGDQGKYWEMHDLLFQNRKTLQMENLKEYARSLGLGSKVFDECLDKGKYTAEVQKDFEDGSAAGVQGTPSFFIGKTGQNGTIQGTLVRGAQPIAAFSQVIERLLGED